MAKGIHAGPVKSEFLEHAAEEQAHADRIAERIVQLGGSPNFSPEGLLSRSHSEYVEGTTLIDMITRKKGLATKVARDMQYQAIMEVWLYIHVPLSFALLAALIGHIVSSFFYW